MNKKGWGGGFKYWEGFQQKEIGSISLEIKLHQPLVHNYWKLSEEYFMNIIIDISPTGTSLSEHVT